MNETQKHNQHTIMSITTYNPARHTRKAMNQATANMGTRYTCKTIDNQRVVWFTDVNTGIIVPAKFYTDFMLHVRSSFQLSAERNDSWIQFA